MAKVSLSHAKSTACTGDFENLCIFPVAAKIASPKMKGASFGTLPTARVRYAAQKGTDRQ